MARAIDARIDALFHRPEEDGDDAGLACLLHESPRRRDGQPGPPRRRAVGARADMVIFIEW
jgi:hypothetical protein